MTAPVQIGVYSAASRMPTTAALIPASARRNPTDPRSQSQNGSAPKISRNDGRKMPARAIVAPGMPFGAGAATAPRYPANVNSGPGTACAAPYPARNWLSVTQPGSTTVACSSGRTTWPPPNTSAPDRKKASNRATGWPSAARRSGSPSSRPGEQREAGDPDATRDRARLRAGRGSERRCQQQAADERPGGDDRDLGERRRPGERHGGRGQRERPARPVGRQASRPSARRPAPRPRPRPA